MKKYKEWFQKDQKKKGGAEEKKELEQLRQSMRETEYRVNADVIYELRKRGQEDIK